MDACWTMGAGLDMRDIYDHIWRNPLAKRGRISRMSPRHFMSVKWLAIVDFDHSSPRHPHLCGEDWFSQQNQRTNPPRAIENVCLEWTSGDSSGYREVQDLCLRLCDLCDESGV